MFEAPPLRNRLTRIQSSWNWQDVASSVLAPSENAHLCVSSATKVSSGTKSQFRHQSKYNLKPRNWCEKVTCLPGRPWSSPSRPNRTSSLKASNTRVCHAKSLEALVAQGKAFAVRQQEYTIPTISGWRFQPS